MSHKPPIQPGETVDRYLARVQREHAAGGNGLPEGIEGTPIVVNGQTIGWNIGGEFFTQEEVDTLIATGKFPEEPGGGGGGGITFSQQQELAAQQAKRNRDAATVDFKRQQTFLDQEHQNALALLEQELQNATGLQAQAIQANIDLENLRFENDLKELGIQFENDLKKLQLQFENQLKQQFIGEIGAERRTLIQEKGRAQERQVERAGKDPFRFSFGVRGQEAPTTPEDIFKREQQAFINQPLPQLNFNATLPELQAQLGTVQGIRPPTGGFLGLPSLAHGGIVSPSSAINMQRGSDGVFSRVPAIVGDAGPELALLPPGAEIIPLNRLQGIDLTGIPRAQEGVVVPPSSPQLVLKEGTRGVFVLGPDGQYHLVTDPETMALMGLSFSDVETLPAAEFDALVTANRGANVPKGATGFSVSEEEPPVTSFQGPELVRMEGMRGVFALGPDGSYHLIINPQSMTDMGLSFEDVVVLSAEEFDRTVTSNRGANIPQGSTDFSFLPPAPEPPPAFDPEALEAIINLQGLPFLQNVRLGAGLPATGPLGQEAFSRLGVLPPGVTQPVTTGAFATRNPLTLLPALTELGVPQDQAQQISGQFGPFVSPFKAASTLGLGLSNLLPQEQTGFQSLYGLLGFTPEDINAQIAGVTPTGRFDNPFRIGFTGTRL